MSRRKRRRLIQLACFVAIIGGMLALGFDPRAIASVVWGWMQVIAAWSREHPALAAGLFVLATAATKIAPFTGGGAVMVFGGFLFGTELGGVLSATGATLSALLVRAAGRHFFGDIILDRWGERFARVEERILANGFSYYIALRLIPIFPAWLVNLVAVVIPLRASVVAAGTFLGVLPISCIMAGVGSTLSVVTSRADELSWRLLLDLDILLPLGGLMLLALLPPLLQLSLERRRRRRAGAETSPSSERVRARPFRRRMRLQPQPESP